MMYLDVRDFNNCDLPEWMNEDQGDLICSFLNYYLSKEQQTRGARFHILNRFPSESLYLHYIDK